MAPTGGMPWCRALKEGGSSRAQTVVLWLMFAVVGMANWFLTFCLFIEAPLLVATGAKGVGGLPESMRLSSYLNVSMVRRASRERGRARATPANRRHSPARPRLALTHVSLHLHRGIDPSHSPSPRARSK